MKKNNKTLTVTTIIALSLLTCGQTAIANIVSAKTAYQLIQESCPSHTEANQELARYKSKILTAGTLEEARRIALEPADDAINALENAQNLVPFSDDLKSAESRLIKARTQIMLASSQDQVADEFDGMMLAGLDNDRAAHVNIGSGGCDYSTGELIAIVVGLILGIIPGIILLVVLC